MSSTCKEIKFHGWNDAVSSQPRESSDTFRISANSLSIALKHKQEFEWDVPRVCSNQKYLMSLLAETKRCIIQATKFKVKLILLDKSSIFTNILKYSIQSECKPPVCSISIIDLWVFSLRLGLGLQIWIQIKDGAY